MELGAVLEELPCLSSALLRRIWAPKLCQKVALGRIVTSSPLVLWTKVCLGIGRAEAQVTDFEGFVAKGELHRDAYAYTPQKY